MFVVGVLLAILCANALTNDICSLPLVTGPCDAYFPSFGYDPKVKACVDFVYGGCGGNENRFPTKEACEAECPKNC